LSVTLAKVPAYLQKGELFRNLKQNEGTEVEEHENIVVPKDCMKQTIIVQNNRELLYLVHSLRYWAVDEMPETVYTILTSPHVTPIEEMKRTAKDYPEVKLMPLLHRKPIQYHLAIAAGHGDLQLMTYLHEKRNMELRRTECMLAAAQGQLPCLQYAHEHGCNLKSEGYRSGFWWDVVCTCMHACMRSAAVMSSAYITRTKTAVRWCGACTQLTANIQALYVSTTFLTGQTLLKAS
jgi:hypothetical protein